MSEWICYADQEEKLLERGVNLGQKIFDRSGSRRGRTREQCIEHSQRGLKAEAIVNRGHEKWADEHWEESELRGWDGGYDTPDKRQVKSLDYNRPSNHRRVFVSDHDLADDFIVVEIDEPRKRGRVLGFFKKADIQNFWYKEDRLVRGVLVDRLRHV